MLAYENYFKGKKITLMGLGLLGRGLGDAEFLAEQGAELTVTDLKSKEELAPSLKPLAKYKNIKYVLGKHRLEDFSARGRRGTPDFILKAASVPLDSPFIAEARKNNTPVEMDASLFAKLAPAGVKIIGITGTRGKTTTTMLIYGILKRAFGVRRVHLGGNIKDTATLPLLKKVKAGDYVVLELDSWQLQGFHDSKISPQVAVFTTFFDDHLNYYKGDRGAYFSDKASIFRNQKAGDTLVVGEQAAARVRSAQPPVPPVIARAAYIPSDWKLKILGEHNRLNAACAAAAARAVGVSDAVIKKAAENFKAVPGRLQYLRTIKGIKIYNDNNATTPDATVVALKALRSWQPGARKIILICGGTDKVLGRHEILADEMSKSCKSAILLKETGTEKLKELIKNYKLKIKIKEKETLKECVEEAMKIGEKGDIILFSPAFASFGKWFKNEYDRGEQFVKIVESL